VTTAEPNRARLVTGGTVFGLAALFTAAWWLGLWLVNVMMAAGAAVLAILDRLETTRAAHRLAVAAVIGFDRRYDSGPLVTRLAVAAADDPDALDDAMTRTIRARPGVGMQNPAVARLSTARELLSQVGCPPWVPGLLRPSRTGTTTALLLGLSVVGGVVSGNELFLIVLSAAMAVLVVTFILLRRHEQLVGDLTAAATITPGLDTATGYEVLELDPPAAIPDRHLRVCAARVVARAGCERDVIAAVIAELGVDDGRGRAIRFSPTTCAVGAWAVSAVVLFAIVQLL